MSHNQRLDLDALLKQPSGNQLIPNQYKLRQKDNFNYPWICGEINA